MHRHDPRWCYINPASQAYHPDVRERRIQQARAKGIALGPEFTKLRPPATNGKAHNWMVGDLVGALSLCGLQADKGMIDRVLDMQQQQEGKTIAHLVHTSDGQVPTTIYSVNPGHQRLPPSTLDVLLNQDDAEEGSLVGRVI